MNLYTVDCGEYISISIESNQLATAGEPSDLVGSMRGAGPGFCNAKGGSLCDEASGYFSLSVGLFWSNDSGTTPDCTGSSSSGTVAVVLVPPLGNPEVVDCQNE